VRDGALPVDDTGLDRARAPNPTGLKRAAQTIRVRLRGAIAPPIKQSGLIQTRVSNPAWSPDGRHVVYERDKGYNRGSLT
jgi:hypothetical protein